VLGTSRRNRRKLEYNNSGLLAQENGQITKRINNENTTLPAAFSPVFRTAFRWGGGLVPPLPTVYYEEDLYIVLGTPKRNRRNKTKYVCVIDVLGICKIKS